LRIQNNDRSHKIEIKPNNKQRTYFAKASGTARFSYNWALDQWQKQYQAHKENPDLPKPTQGGLRKQLNAIKRIEYPWMLEVTKNAPQMAIIQLGEAFKTFFQRTSKLSKI
jgi:putative transposase